MYVCVCAMLPVKMYMCMYKYCVYMYHTICTCTCIIVLHVKVFIVTDRLTMRDLLVYLMSDDNMILDSSILDRHMDMSRPLNLYFINSSHNSYLNGTARSHDSHVAVAQHTMATLCL